MGVFIDCDLMRKSREEDELLKEGTRKRADRRQNTNEKKSQTIPGTFHKRKTYFTSRSLTGSLRKELEDMPRVLHKALWSDDLWKEGLAQDQRKGKMIQTEKDG